ncbi:hypothetical protein BH20ACT15_BH20ACT15_09940 [soil metagenome]
MTRSLRHRPTAAIAAIAAIALTALAACGNEETLSAQEFVDKVNDEGVKLSLGEPLITDDTSKELFAVELQPVASLPGSGRGPVGGSLSAYDDAEGAEDELSSCAASADLLCYRAGNIVVVLEGGGIEAQQLGVAIERLSE